MLEELTKFTVVERVKLVGGTLDILPSRFRTPVARIAWQEEVREAVWGLVGFSGMGLPKPWDVYVGPNLDVKIGSLTRFAAYDADGEPVGHITHKRGRFLSIADITEFHQPGLETLVGEHVGVGAKFRTRRGSDLMPFSGIVDAATPTKRRFRGDSSAGFDISSPPGVIGTWHISVHDPRVNRLLVLSCLL
jgi:hypothetical protein